jgi:hypothetical protein
MPKWFTYVIVAVAIAWFVAGQILPGEWMLVLGGAGLLAAGAYLFVSTRRFVGTAWKGDGAVIELVPGRRLSTYPKVRFMTATGEEIEFTSSFGTNLSPYRVGQPVPVLYSPFDPNKARINFFWQLWFVTVLLSGLGLLFTIVGVIIVLAAG